MILYFLIDHNQHGAHLCSSGSHEDSLFLDTRLQGQLTPAYRDANGTFKLHPWANQFKLPLKVWKENNSSQMPAFRGLPSPCQWSVLFGGIGLYSSMRDYLKLFKVPSLDVSGKHLSSWTLINKIIEKLSGFKLSQRCQTLFWRQK